MLRLRRRRQVEQVEQVDIWWWLSDVLPGAGENYRTGTRRTRTRLSFCLRVWPTACWSDSFHFLLKSDFTAHKTTPSEDQQWHRPWLNKDQRSCCCPVHSASGTSEQCCRNLIHCQTLHDKKFWISHSLENPNLTPRPTSEHQSRVTSDVFQPISSGTFSGCLAAVLHSTSCT